ncbi:hypothetical protein [Prosthecobacter sp.]|uniref:hypothetical protein n=1 Tax=Prosthecobacter sp. TaxID=1965333 RepID=UPI00378494D6
MEAAIDAGREALHAVVRVKDERDPGPEHKENEAMRISNIVNAERTATGMLKLPAARRTGAEFWARQRPRQSRDQHQDNEHPLPPGSHYGAHPLTHVRRILGCSANAAQAGGEETALIPHSSRIELASTIHGPSISTMNPHSKRRPLLFTPRSPWGGRLESHSFRSHMRASENRGTVPTPKPGESFRLARPQRKENASAREGGVVGSPPAAQAGFDPNARLYRVTGDPKTGIGTATPINPKDINPKNAQIWINGMNNDVQAATRLGLDHTGKSEFYMIHNPTNGFASDSVEATAQKMGLRTQVANSTRDLLRHFDLPTANVTSHSQGTMILNSALEDLHKEGKNMKGINLNHHGAAANSLLTAVLAHRIGANKPKFEGHPLDAVHNIIGMNTLNPLRIAGSLLASPLLFNSDPDKSPHSKRNGHAGKLSKIFQSKLFNSLNPTQ